MAEDTLTRAEEEALARARRKVGGSARGASPRRTSRGGGAGRHGPSRSATLDLARGAVVAVAVTFLLAGDPGELPVGLRPAGGNGFGVADLLPVTFTVLVGVAMAWQLAAHRRASAGWWTLRHLRRVAVLCAVGLALAWLRTSDPDALRLTGPLVRLAIGGVLAWIVVTRLSPRLQGLLVATTTLGHWMLLGRGVFGAGGPVARAEAQLLAGRAATPVDPDGLAALGPTVVAILAGVWIGRWLAGRPAGPATVTAFSLAGLYAVAAALGWAQLLPVNAELWTGSTVLLGVGVTLVVLAVAHLLVDVLPGRRALRWIGATGAEALPIYALAVMLGLVLERTALGGVREGVRSGLFEPLLGTHLGPLATAAVGTAVLCRVAVALVDRGQLLRA